jgi:hypothetical protein
LLLRWLLGLAALSSFLLVPATTQADDPPTPISAGAGADWGVKESFRNYVLGPIAHGSISVSDGASENPDGSFHFPIASGEYDPVTGATVLRFGGAVHFKGHDGSLEVSVTNPRVELTPEGGALYADMTSKPNSPGAAATAYPGVRVADLDLSGKTPTVAAGTTTWPALPAALTNDAVPAFAGFYGAGTALDSFSFGYDGPGGVPQLEVWTPGGTPLWGKALTGTIPAGVGRVAFDPARDRIWFGSYDFKKVVALNDETLAPTGIEVSTGHNTRNVAVDPGSGNVYSIDTDVRAIRDNGSGFALDPTPIDTFSGGSNALATASDGTIYTVVESSLFRYRPSSGMVRETFAIPSGYGAVQLTASGRIFLIPSGAPPVAEVTITGSTATLDEIPGTSAVSGAAIAPDGRVAYVELDYSEYPKVKTTLHELTPDGSDGWTDRKTSGLSGVSNAYGVWSGDGETLFLASSDFKDVVAVENDVIVTRLKGPGYLAAIQDGPDGHVYAAWRDGSIARLGVSAISPQITAQPVDQTLTVAAAGEGGTIQFAAAATGDPAPSLQWQRRAPGSTRWTDLAGETGETLTVVAGSTDSGARYRAVFTNAGGKIASAVASLTVQVTPPATVTPGTGGAAAPVPIPAAVAKPKIAKLAATQKLGGSRLATIARLTCPAASGRCAVTAPRRVSIKIDGERFAATVLAPKSLAPGSVVPLKVRLPKQAAERLNGGEAKLRLRIVLSTDAAWSTQTIQVTLTN